MLIRSVKQEDVDAITVLNNHEARWTGEKDKSFFKAYLKIPFFYVVEEQGKLWGFLMAMDESCEYDSKNFLWFKKRFKKFYYVDRVIVDSNLRGKGLGTALYNELLKNRGSTPIVAEVSVDPPNTASTAFHEKLGFKVVGTFSADGKKTCRMYKLE